MNSAQHKINHTTSLLKYHYKLWLIIGSIFFLGTFAPFSLEYIKKGFQDSLEKRLQVLLGSDVVISSRLKLPVDQIKAKIPIDTQSKMVRSLYSMIKAGNSETIKKAKSRLARVSFIPEGFPFYGELIPKGKIGQFYSGKIVFVWPELLNILEVKIGDEVQIGLSKFMIAGVVENDPGQVMQAQALAPRVYISSHHIKDVGLIQKGSTVSYGLHLFFKDKKLMESSIEDLKESFDKEGTRVRGVKENGEFVSRSISIVSNYLGLGSFFNVLLSFLAIAFVLNKMFKREEATINFYSLLGVRPSWVFLKYLKCFLIVSVIASVLSASLGYYLSPLLSDILKTKYKIDIMNPSLKSAIAFIFFGVGSTLFFYWAMALKFLRSFFSIAKWKIWTSWFLCFGWVLLVAFYWTRSWKLIGITSAAFFVLYLLIYISGVGVYRLLEKIVSGEKLPIIRLGVLQMSRFKWHSLSTIFLLTASIGIFGLINTVSGGLELGLNYDEESKRPAMFLFDIQPDQVDGLTDLVSEHKGKIRKISPLVRARLVAINGEILKIDESTIKSQENSRRERFLKRGINLSYQSKLYNSEKIVKGTDFFAKKESDDRMKISVEVDYAKLLDVEIGSEMTFEVLGVEFTGVVENIRKISWQSFDPNFFIVVSKGFLEDAPHTYVAALNMPHRSIPKFQNKLFDELPNVSSLDVRRVLQRIVKIIKNVRGIFQVYGLFVILLGVLIIFGLIQLHWEDRIKDMKFFDLLGIQEATRSRIMSTELLLIAIISTFFSLGFQVVLGKIILVRIFEIDEFEVQSVLETFGIVVLIFSFLLIYFNLKKIRKN